MCGAYRFGLAIRAANDASTLSQACLHKAENDASPKRAFEVEMDLSSDTTSATDGKGSCASHTRIANMKYNSVYSNIIPSDGVQCNSKMNSGCSSIVSSQRSKGRKVEESAVNPVISTAKNHKEKIAADCPLLCEQTKKRKRIYYTGSVDTYMPKSSFSPSTTFKDTLKKTGRKDVKLTTGQQESSSPCKSLPSLPRSLCTKRRYSIRGVVNFLRRKVWHFQPEQTLLSHRSDESVAIETINDVSDVESVNQYSFIKQSTEEALNNSSSDSLAPIPIPSTPCVSEETARFSSNTITEDEKSCTLQSSNFGSKNTCFSQEYKAEDSSSRFAPKCEAGGENTCVQSSYNTDDINMCFQHDFQTNDNVASVPPMCNTESNTVNSNASLSLFEANGEDYFSAAETNVDDDSLDSTYILLSLCTSGKSSSMDSLDNMFDSKVNDPENDAQNGCPILLSGVVKNYCDESCDIGALKNISSVDEKQNKVSPSNISNHTKDNNTTTDVTYPDLIRINDFYSSSEVGPQKIHRFLQEEFGYILGLKMLKQILDEMRIDPELLQELDEEQKQILFCKMREEQVRRWTEKEKELERQQKNNNHTKKENKKGHTVGFVLDTRGDPWTWVMGDHVNDLSIEEILERESQQRADQLAEQEALKLQKENEEKLQRMQQEEEEAVEAERMRKEEELRRQEEEATRLASDKEAREAQRRLEQAKKREEEERQKLEQLKRKSTRMRRQSSLEVEGIKTKRSSEIYSSIQDLRRKFEQMYKGALRFIKNGPRAPSVSLLQRKSTKMRRQSSLEVEGIKTKRSSEIYTSIQDLRRKFEQEAERQSKELNQQWQIQEEKARRLDTYRRTIARKAREEYRRSSLVGTSAAFGKSITALKRIREQNEVVMNDDKPCPATSKRISGPPKEGRPTGRDAIVDWFRGSELRKGAVLDSKTKQFHPWFHGMIARVEAEQLLEEKPAGTFLIRVSERIFGYAVSVQTEERCKHYLINALDNQYTFFGNQQVAHKSLADLVAYHKKNPISQGSSEKLIQVCAHTSNPPKFLDLVTDPNLETTKL